MIPTVKIIKFYFHFTICIYWWNICSNWNIWNLFFFFFNWIKFHFNTRKVEKIWNKFRFTQINLSKFITLSDDIYCEIVLIFIILIIFKDYREVISFFWAICTLLLIFIKIINYWIFCLIVFYKLWFFYRKLYLNSIIIWIKNIWQ